MQSKAWQVEKAIRYPCFLIPRTLFFFICLSTALFDPFGGKVAYTIFRSSVWTNSVKFSSFSSFLHLLFCRFTPSFFFSSSPSAEFITVAVVCLPSTESFAASYKQDNYYFSFSSDLSNLRSTSSIQTRKKVDETEREKERESFFKRVHGD